MTIQTAVIVRLNLQPTQAWGGKQCQGKFAIIPGRAMKASERLAISALR